MNTLLLFFAFPVSTIILAIVLEKIIRNSILTASTFFAIFLIVAFTAFDTTFLVYVIAYTILAFIVATIAEIFFKKCKYWNNNIGNLGISENSNDNFERHNGNDNKNNNNSNNSNNSNNNFNCMQETVTANITNNNTGRRSTWCCYRK